MATAYTYQDFEAREGTAEFVRAAINAHKASDAYRTAVDADAYDRQENVTIGRYARILYRMTTTVDPETGEKRSGVAQTDDFGVSNNRIASNFFNRLNTQRVQYSLGNGVSFVQPDEIGQPDEAKEALGEDADHRISEAAHCALIHGTSFLFLDIDRLHVFKFTEFAPLYDEHDGRLRAGIRFWQLAENKPMTAVLYTEDGYSEWREDGDRRLRPYDNGEFAEEEVVHAYKESVAYLQAEDSTTILGGENYGALPIVPMWASRRKQSTLVGMRSSIDAYDLIKSGFANDVHDCATVYWIVKNAGGMTQADLQEFLDRLKIEHIAKVDGIEGAEAVPYTQEVPYQARQALLKELRDGIYEDFGALDVHAVSAGATNDHIDAAYQPMDENASEFEYWVGECIAQVLRLLGIEDRPVFLRNRISNQKEQVEMVVQEAQWLDAATVLRKLPNIKPDEVQAILEGMQGEDMARFGLTEGAENE